MTELCVRVSQKAKEVVAAGITGPEGHQMSRPEEVRASITRKTSESRDLLMNFKF